MKEQLANYPLYTLTVAALFVLGLLYKNWVIEIRDWIESRVSA